MFRSTRRANAAIIALAAALVGIIPATAQAVPYSDGIIIEAHAAEKEYPDDLALRGAAAGSWVEEDGVVKYQRANGSYLSDCWAVIDGERYRFGAEGDRLTGWQEIDGDWYKFDEDGLMITSGWVSAADGYDRYLGEDGRMYANRHYPEGGYFDADGIYDPNVGPYASGGEKLWTEVAGVDREELVASLEEHKDEYLYTPYGSYPCGTPGEGLHCAGFVSRGIYDAGFTNNFDNGPTPNYHEYVADYNLNKVFKDDISQYENTNTWHTTGYVLWAANNNVRWIGYTSHEALVEGFKRGEYQKGDFMMYTYTMPELTWDLVVEHICYCWGEGDEWLVWESMPGGNYIRERSTCGGTIVVLTSVDYLND